LEQSSDRLLVRCVVGGVLQDRKGVNLPESDLRLSVLTDKDREDARWALGAGFDYLALSFVRSAADVRELRELLEAANSEAHIISKVETPQAVADLDAVIAASDAILVARGDLGVEMKVELLPRIQKDICQLCRRTGTPVIVATQMLQSMVDTPVPTRAEVSDVANAIVDGADALMLSAETAVGQYPVKAVEMIRRIAAETEHNEQGRVQHDAVNAAVPGVTRALAQGMAVIAGELNTTVNLAWTSQGNLARLVSKYRLPGRLVALTHSQATRRRMALYFGVWSVCLHRPSTERARIEAVDRLLTERGWAAKGDSVVMGIGPQELAVRDTGEIDIHLVDTVRPL
jgi:pyruvate kinase